VVMLCGRQDFGYVAKSLVQTPNLKKLFFSRSPPDIRHEPRIEGTSVDFEW
jgi:hypothetical protein